MLLLYYTKTTFIATLLSLFICIYYNYKILLYYVVILKERGGVRVHRVGFVWQLQIAVSKTALNTLTLCFNTKQLLCTNAHLKRNTKSIHYILSSVIKIVTKYK